MSDATWRAWTVQEVAIIRAHFEAGGAPACVRMLPGRSAGAVQQKAYQLGLRKAHPSPRVRHRTSEEIDAAILRVYRSEPRRGMVEELARHVRRPRWWVSKRARELGCATPRIKEPDWSEAEVEIIEEHAAKALAVIQRILARHGYHRTETAISLKLRRLGTCTQDPDAWTGTGLARLMGVDFKTVARWIEKEGLPARRRGTARTEQQGGDMWWIRRRALRKWITANAHSVDIRKVDKYWFIDLMSGP